MKKIFIILTFILFAKSASSQIMPIGSTVAQVTDSLRVWKLEYTEVTAGTMSPRTTEINVPLVNYLNTNWSIVYEFQKPDTSTRIMYTAYKVTKADYDFLESEIMKTRGEPKGDHPTAAIGKYWVVDNKFLIALSLEGDKIYLEHRDIDFAKKSE